MFEHLKKYRVILVTGPQRSGTRIAAKMIAQDTGHRFIDERDFDTHDLGKWQSLIIREVNVVIQCPALCRWIHTVGWRDDVAAVLMRRNLTAIRASEERIGWQVVDRARELAKYGAKEGEIAQIKYKFWEKEQRRAIKHALEVEFDGLRAHPLWIESAQRQIFNWWQTEAQSMRVFVCTLAYRHIEPVRASWAVAFAHWQEVAPKTAFDHYLAFGDNGQDTHDTVVAKYRRAQQVFLNGDWDVFVALEDDMIIPPDTFPRLMNALSLGADVAYGLYVWRRDQFRWSAYVQQSENGGHSYSEVPELARKAWGKVKTVAGLGQGLVAYQRHVMVKLPFRRGGPHCSDWYFAADAQKAGYVQRCDLGIVCGHVDAVNDVIYWPDVEADNLYRTDRLSEYEMEKINANRI